MENKLTKEEVLHVAHLARIYVSESELENYQYSLKTMIDEIDKIKEYDDFDEDKMISPCEHDTELVNKDLNICSEDLLKNVPHKKGNFIEVPVMRNE